LASFRLKAMLSRTVMCGIQRVVLEHHGDVPLLGRHVVDDAAADGDLAAADLLQPAIMRSSVDLPQPEGPTSTVNCPSSMSMSTPRGIGPGKLVVPQVCTRFSVLPAAPPAAR
jgi:hypothetical protein